MLCGMEREIPPCLGTRLAMKYLTRSLWAAGGFRRQLLREILSAKKAGQTQRDVKLQESVRGTENCLEFYTSTLSYGHCHDVDVGG